MFNKNIKILKNIIYAIRITWSISHLYIFLVIFISLLTSIYKVFTTLFIRVIIQNIENNNKNMFISSLNILILCSITTVLINSIISNKVIPQIQNNYNYFFQSKIYKKYLKFKLNEIYDPKFYDQYYYVLQNSNSSFLNTVDLLGKFISSILSIGGITTILFMYDFRLFIIILIGVIISFFSSLKKEKSLYDLKVKYTLPLRKIEYINRLFYLPEYAKEVRGNKNDILFNYFKDSYKDIKDIISKSSNRLIYYDSIVNLTSYLSLIIVIYLLGINVLNNKIDIATFSMLYAGTQTILSELMKLFSSFPLLYSQSLNIDKYNEFMKTDTGSKENCQTYIDKFHSIEFKNVSFSYNKIDNVLENVSFKINRTDKEIIIIGKNGSGKSTLLNLILGLIKADYGEILINGINIKDLNKYTYLFSIVFQDFKLFSVSIAENISLKNDLNLKDEDKIIQALKVVGLYEKVSSLQNGIYSIVSSEFEENSIGFSLGEQQKIALARAYFKDSEVLILDEPYSFSDNFSKNEIDKIIKIHFNNKLIIRVTHDNKDYSKNENVLIIENKNVRNYNSL